MITKNDLKTLFKVNYIIYEKMIVLYYWMVAQIDSKSYYIYTFRYSKVHYLCEQVIGLKLT